MSLGDIDIDYTDNLRSAIYNINTEQVKELLENGCDIDIVHIENKFGNHPLKTLKNRLLNYQGESKLCPELIKKVYNIELKITRTILISLISFGINMDKFFNIPIPTYNNTILELEADLKSLYKTYGENVKMVIFQHISISHISDIIFAYYR